MSKIKTEHVFTDGKNSPARRYRLSAAGCQVSGIGHFGRRNFPWEQTDKAEALRNLVITKIAA
jgi:hypothetical protein